LFLLLDSDRDGKLSSGEISAAADVLKKLDRDGDGNVTVEELIAAMPRPDSDK
jgi:Ca2+-binding EF-hand superfamily protein